MSALANELRRFLDFLGKQGGQRPTRRLRAHFNDEGAVATRVGESETVFTR